MNNLKLFSELSLNLPRQSPDEVILFAAIDIERNRLFFASSANFIYTTSIPSSQNENVRYKDLSFTEAGSSLDLECGDSITSMDYLMEKEALIFGTFNGLLLLYIVDGNTTEVVGKVEGGVRCISPSPDGNLLGIMTGLGQILVMTHDWDVLYEIAVEDVPEDADVDGYLFSRSSFGSHISWRGDGKYFATLSNVGTSPLLHKKLKVWERDSGALTADSEAKCFMGSLLEWMPTGVKIAAVNDREAENKCASIVFFERNGLERSSCRIDEPMNVTIEALKWNCNSDLLTALVRHEGYESIKIWFFSNNHWYLKQEIRYSREDGVRFLWHPTKPLELICWTLHGQITVYKFLWISAVTENSIALVIDGSKILATPLSLSLLPPPMYLFSLKFPSSVRAMAFWSKNSDHLLSAFCSDGCLCVVQLPALDHWGPLEGKELVVETSQSETTFGSVLHLIWLDLHNLLGVFRSGSSHINFSSQSSSKKDMVDKNYLLEIELVCLEDHISSLGTCSGWHANVSDQRYLQGSVIGIARCPVKRNSAFVQFDGGQIYGYTPKLGITEKILGSNGTSFSSSCPWMNVAPIDDNGHFKHLIFGLDEICRLHAGENILCNNCSSFSFYSNSADNVITHLILTTKQDLLFIVDICDILYENLEVKYKNFIQTGNRRKDDENRSFFNIWERGARAIGVLHGDEAAVILQTARGNLECVYPRKLVLSSIANALLERRFRDALMMVRRHRIDFNIIVDHCGWQAFMHSATEFVRQVKNLSYITEFVCSIKNENVAETLYRDYMPLPSSKEAKDVKAINKVSSVLLSIRKALEEQLPESPSRELCILTTLARSDPPALEKALERVKFIRDMELSNSNHPKRNSYPSSEEALKHLLWLSCREAVFEAALGLYDLNLAGIVALNSQRDPKEFLPFLQSLEHMPKLLMQYNIDLKLQRYDKALKHIISAGDAYHDDFFNLLKSNPQLFPLGLQLTTDSDKRRQVLEAWGDHLSDEKHFEDAATTYLCCSSLEKALKAYRDSGNWRGALTVAGFLNKGTEEIIQLAQELCEELKALGKPAEAAKVALEYCEDVATATSLLISAREWEEALRLALLHQRDDLISEVKNAALECGAMQIGEYAEGLEKIGKYVARYLAVRHRRLLLAAKLQSEELSTSLLEDDAASEASSSFSGMSAYTTGTNKCSAASISSSKASKARGTRRLRNRGKIRAGSPDEETALVEHLRGMSITEGAKREAKSLLVCLTMFGEEGLARKMQNSAECFQVSQMAAVKLTEDAVSSDRIDEDAFTLVNYMKKVRSEVQKPDVFSWQSRVLLSP